MYAFYFSSASLNLWSSMPNTSGVNAIGIWMIACIIMVSGALTEYGIILYIMFNKRNLAKIINYKKNQSKHKHKDDDSNRDITTHGRTDNEKLFVVSQNTTGGKTENGVNCRKEDEEATRNDVIHDIKLKIVDAMYPCLCLLPFFFSLLWCTHFCIRTKYIIMQYQLDL